jgi:lysozyme family protein
MKDLTVEDVEPIYKKNYWDKIKGDDLPDGLDLCVFDFGVNAGPGRAAKFLQKLLGVTQDGGIGPQTLGALQSAIGEDVVTQTREMIEKYQSMRQEYYEGLSTFDTFGKGWTRRVEETTHEAISMT